MSTLLRSQFLGSEPSGLLASSRRLLDSSRSFAQIPRALCKSVRHYASRNEAAHGSQHLENENPASSTIKPSVSKFANSTRRKFEHITDGLQRKLAYTELRLGPLSASAADLQRAFDAKTADPFEVIKSHLQDDESLSLDTIRVCVVAAKNQIFKLRRTQRAEAVAAKNFGVARQVISRIMDDHNTWVRLVVHDGEAFSALCYFAVKEGVDPIVADWVKIEDIDDDLLQILIRETGNRPDLFRNLLLRGLMAGYIMQETRSADRALLCLKEIMMWRRIQRQLALRDVPHLAKYEPRLFYEASNAKIDPRRMSEMPAFTLLSVQLCKNGWYETDPSLYDWLVGLCSSSPHSETSNSWTLHNENAEPWEQRGRLQMKLIQARLKLWHPSSPDAKEFLDLIQNICLPKRDGLGIELPKPSVGKALQTGFQRAYVVSKAHRRYEDAAWLAPIYEHTFGEKLKVEDSWDFRMPPNWKPPFFSTPQSDIADGHPTVWRTIKT